MKTANKIKNLVLAAVTLFSMAGAATVAPALAAIPCPNNPSNMVNDLTECDGKFKEAAGANNTLDGIVKAIIDTLIAVIALVSVFMIILGGFGYTTSQGDAGKVKKAKDTILYGVIGLVVALLAFAIVNFVVKSVFGTA